MLTAHCSTLDAPAAVDSAAFRFAAASFSASFPHDCAAAAALPYKILHARQNGREKLSEFVVAVRTELGRCAELVGQVAGNVFKMVPERGGRGLDLALCQRSCDLVPNFQIRLDQRAGVDRPAMECDGGLGGDKAGRLHLLGPQAVMRGDDELRVREMRLQQFAELVAVAGINGHNHVVQEREGEPIPEEPLHEREV